MAGGRGPAGGTRRVTRADIEAKLGELQGDVEEVGEAAKGIGVAVAGVAAAVLLGAVFLLGKRRGRKKTTTVEIRRV
ncbi:MAG: hypothetical protein ABR511_05780 [Acidimicrobiales bacterium]